MAIVLGSLAVAGVAFLALLVGAVTFLGTTAEPEFTVVGSSLPGDDPSGGGPVFDEPTFSPGDDPGELPVTLSSATSDGVAIALGGDGEWAVIDVEVPRADESPEGSCAPAGWLTDATDRFRTYYDRPPDPVTEALTLSITTYATEAAAQAELLRARTPEYAQCEVEQRVLEVPGVSDATATALPDDARAPGVTYQVDVVGPDPVSDYDFTIVVGRQRAHLDFCGCADLGLAGQQEIARTVARVLAEVQGLPAPG